MNCCLCNMIETIEKRVCYRCNRYFCIECIEIEKKQKIYLLTHNDICIFCRISDNYLIKDCK